jgi:hypothetical protein
MTKEEHPPRGWKKLDYLANGARYGGTTLCVTTANRTPQSQP